MSRSGQTFGGGGRASSARGRRGVASFVATALALLLVGYLAWVERRAGATVPPGGAEAHGSGPAQAAASSKPTASASASPRESAGLVMRGQRIYDESGRLTYQGDIDLTPVFARIAAGQKDRHRNDGTVFGNREGRLPRRPRGYYTEWVIRTPGLRSVGPQRLITGQGGEAYYTPDHYETFVPVTPPR